MYIYIYIYIYTACPSARNASTQPTRKAKSHERVQFPVEMGSAPGSARPYSFYRFVLRYSFIDCCLTDVLFACLHAWLLAGTRGGLFSPLGVASWSRCRASVLCTYWLSVISICCRRCVLSPSFFTDLHSYRC